MTSLDAETDSRLMIIIIMSNCMLFIVGSGQPMSYSAGYEPQAPGYAAQPPGYAPPGPGYAPGYAPGGPGYAQYGGGVPYPGAYMATPGEFRVHQSSTC